MGVRPSDKAIGAVVHALATRSATDIRVAAHGDYVKASVPMHKLEELTSGSFRSFQHTDGRKVVRLTGGVRLPAALAEYVDTFSGLHGFPLDAAPASVEVASGDVTPTVISKTYGIGSVKKSGKQNIQAIGQFQGQYVSPSASTPSWGAVISLLNEECLTASGGQKTLGFVNPLLYKSAHAFN